MSEYFNFNHLYYFMMVAKEGSVTKACKKLFITQPTLSTQLKQFEDTLGHKLFDRKKKRLYLNKKGEIVLHYGSQIFKLRDEMVKNLEEGNDAKYLTTELKIGVIPSLSKSHVFEFVSRIWRKGNIEVHIEEGRHSVLNKKLLSGSIDLLLSDTMAKPGQKGVISRKIFSREIIAVAHPSFASFKKDFPRKLDRIPFLNVSRHSQFRSEIDMFFFSHEIIPHSIGEADDATILRLAAESGRCFIITPKALVKESLNDKKLIILGELPNIRSDMWIITRKDSITLENINDVINFFHQRLNKN